MNQLREKLNAPFRPETMEWRVLQSNVRKDGTPWAQVWPYVSAKHLMERLDDVFGVEGWQDTYKEGRGGFVCELSVLVDEKWITKSGASGAVSKDRGGEGVDPVKEMETRAFRRACEKLGVGRYLHLLPTLYASTYKDDRGRFKGKVKGKDGREQWYSWDPPRLWPGEERVLPERRLPTAQPQVVEEAKAVAPAVAPAKPATAVGMMGETEESAVRRELFTMLNDEPFTQADRVIALRVIEKIGNLVGLKAYLKQWQDEKVKRGMVVRERVPA